MEDFVYKEHPAMTNAPGSKELMCYVLDAVANGSAQRTDQMNPFWHASTELVALATGVIRQTMPKKGDLVLSGVGTNPNV